MIWIWLALRNAHSWATGPLERYFDYVCAHCGVTTAAMVRTFGSASAGDVASAQRQAFAHAEALAHRIYCSAACPNCGRLQPHAETGWEHVKKRIAQKKKNAVPFTVVAGVVTLVLLLVPAIADLRHSSTLLATAVTTAIGIAGLVFGVSWGPVTTPLDRPTGMWFSRDPWQGPSSWFPALGGPAPEIVQPSSFLRNIGFGLFLGGGASATIALILYSATFRDIYVVHTDPQSGPATVVLDGAEAGTTTKPAFTDDVAFVKLEVRTSAVHRVVVRGPDGHESTYVLDSNTTRHGWILAPNAREHGLCLTSETWYYGRKPEVNPDDGVLNGTPPGDRLELGQAYGYVFTSPPPTVETKNGSETRSSLRGYLCDALERDERVPFKSKR
ncbi:MAG: hypothetical protein QM702_21620 [Rubrivivax sp.]